MGMGIVTRIVKTILSYIDLKLMETLMADPAFALLLLIE